MLRNFLLVGGASAYAPGLVQALIEESDRHDLELVRLYDIAEERLKIVEDLCSALVDHADAPFRIEATTEQSRAVQNIDLLLNSSRPGGFEARHIDETLPLEFGIPGQETVGPGGFFFALRSIPAALDLAADVERHAPDAIWLNYTNPTNIVAQALIDNTDLDVIALCDQSDEDLRAIADASGYSGDVDYSFECCGLNHATWYRDIRIGGEALDVDASDIEPPDYYDEEHKIRFRHSVSMAGDHRGWWPNSYLPYYTEPRDFVELARRQGTRTQAILEGLNDYYDHFEREARSKNPTLRHFRGSSGFGDMAADTVAALSSQPPSEIVLNVENRGVSDAFGDDTVVEARVGISVDGLQRRRAPSVPEFARPLLDELETYQRNTASAAVSGDLEQLTEALASNPLVDDTMTARKMIRRAPDAYGDALPQLSS